MAACLSPVPFPICVRAASVLATTVFVKRTEKHRLCYYEGAVDKCEMPANLTIANGFYPVVANGTGALSVHGESVLDETYPNATYVTPKSVKTVYVQSDLPDLKIVLESKNCTITGRLADNAHPVVGQIVVTQPNAIIENIDARQIEYSSGLHPLQTRITNVTIAQPIQFAPAYLDVDVNLEGAEFTNVSGNYVAVLHHRGTINATNSSVIWLPRASGSAVSAVNVYGTGSALNVAKLTGIFGSQYEIAQAAGTIVAHNIQAEQLAQALVLPAIVAAAVVFFSNADKLSR